VLGGSFDVFCLTESTSNFILPPASICHWGVGG
jgi:hypothetical protein